MRFNPRQLLVNAMSTGWHTRAELASITGLCKTTVKLHMGELIQRGKLRARPRPQPGRQGLNPDEFTLREPA